VGYLLSKLDVEVFGVSYSLNRLHSLPNLHISFEQFAFDFILIVRLVLRVPVYFLLRFGVIQLFLRLCDHLVLLVGRFADIGILVRFEEILSGIVILDKIHIAY